MLDEDEVMYCERCHKTLKAKDNFYSSYNLEKYPKGKLNMCKKCITAHVDNSNPDTFLWILQEADLPYIPKEWTNLMKKHMKSGKPLTGQSILGKYFSKMRLNQYKDYRWKDNELIQELEKMELERAMKAQGYSAAEIDVQSARLFSPMPQGELVEPQAPIEQLTEKYEAPMDYFTPPQEEDFDMGLTEEDITYLRLKWGKSYRPEEWVALEQLYEEMLGSYDIQSAGHIDTLKLVCKTSLKANQLLDLGDIDGAQKMTKMYNELMKSGKFKLWTMKNFSQLSLGVC